MLQLSGYFESIGVEVPTSVCNAIEDVFMENDNIETVECYHIEDLDQFQKDLRLENTIELTVDGPHLGNTHNVWTYYGDVEYSYSEFTTLRNNDGDVVEKVSEISNDNDTIVNDRKDWIVTLVESVNWGSGSEGVERNLTLYIFCPESSESYEYQDVYEKVREV